MIGPGSPSTGREPGTKSIGALYFPVFAGVPSKVQELCINDFTHYAAVLVFVPVF